MKDLISESVGDVGRFQVSRIALLYLVSLPGLAHIFCMVFGFSKTDFWCSSSQSGLEEVRNETVNKCEDAFLQQPCEQFDYDRSFWSSTIIMEYDLVCDRDYLKTWAKFSIFAGFGIGVFVTGLVSDRFGRRNAIVLFSQLLFGSGLLATVMPNIVGFICVWFFVGAASIGVYTSCYVWAIECVSGKWTIIVGLGFTLAWPIARLILALVAYLARDWKIMFQFFSGLHILTPLAMTLVPESTRWLITTRRHQEALAVLNRISETNGRPPISQDSFDSLVAKHDSPRVRESFLVVFRTPELKVTTLILYWIWFTVSFTLFGFDLNWQTLTGNLFVTFTIGSFLHIPTRLLSIPIVLRGRSRKYPVQITFLLGGLAFLSTLAFDRGDYDHDWPIVTLAMVGTCSLSFTFCVLYPYTAEIYPTSIRNSSVGACSVMARLGGISAIFVTLLAEVSLTLPVILFACGSLSSAVLCYWMPDTGEEGRTLPNCMQDVREECERKRRSSKTASKSQDTPDFIAS